MSELGINSLKTNNFDYEKKTNQNNNVTTDVTPSKATYSNDNVINTKKAVVSSNPFEKPSTPKANTLEKALATAREKNDSKALLDIAKIQLEKNIIPNVKGSDLFREAYNMALSEMDSDTLYEIGNFDATHNLLPEVSSEFIFKMADMTRKIY